MDSLNGFGAWCREELATFDGEAWICVARGGVGGVASGLGGFRNGETDRRSHVLYIRA